MDGKEVPAAKETFSTTKQTVALQTRLLLGGEALNPDKLDLKKVSDENLRDISNQTFDILSIASTNERSQYWQEKSEGDASLNSYETQMKSWVSDVVKFVNQENFTEKEAMDMYNTYFIGEGKISAIDRYVISIVNELSQLKQSKTGVNLDEILEQGLPEIKKMANIFGGNSSEIIENLILARAKLTDPAKKQELIEQANEEKTVEGSPTLRLNWLNPDEERLLNWLDSPILPISTEARQTKETPDVDFTVSYEQNRKAADQFIAVLRNPKHLKTDPNWPNYLNHDYGFVFDKNNGGTIANPELLAVRYHLPFATYSNHLIPEVSHANLVIHGPFLDSQDNKWKITIYDPYQLDAREEILENVHNQQEALAKISYNKLWEREFLQNNEDLSFTNDPELRSYYEVLTNAKLAPFQQDMINCYPYCFFVSSMLNALKPGQTNFKTHGIDQFLSDYHLKIKNRDEVLKKLN